MTNLRSLPLSVLASALFYVALLSGTAPLPAQSPAPAVRITSAINSGQLVTLRGNTHPAATAQNDQGPVSADFPLTDMTLVLSRSADQQAAFDAFVASQYDAHSPNFHQWLTPDDIGTRFGPAAADIATITNWLAAQGFAVKQVSPDRMSIRFGGTASQVQTSFHTQIHNLSVNGVAHFANMSDPQIPAALSSVVVGIKALHNFMPRPLHKLGSKVQFSPQTGNWQRIADTAISGSTSFNSPAVATTQAAISGSVKPQFGIGVPASTNNGAYLVEDVAPYDFATMYNVLPLWQAATPITGTGQTIAIAGTSKINLADVTTFRSAFGLPAGLTPVQIDTGAGPAAIACTGSSLPCNISDQIENSLDVEWAGAVAPGAQVKLVVTGQNAQGTVDTLYDSAQYVVNNLTAKILSVSYGACELAMGTSGNVAIYNLWQSAAAEGISVFVSTGDSGSPSCDQNQDGVYGYPYSAQYGLSVSGLASTPFTTSVGGTDFSWCKPTINSSGNLVGCASTTATAGPYWNTSNNASLGNVSAAGYVPETPWNDSCQNPIWASYIESIATYLGVNTITTPEESCNFVLRNYATIYNNYNAMLAPYVDTVGGSGGASNCVVNTTDPNSSTGALGTCTASATTTGASYGNLALANDGWQKPYWQTGVSGIPADGVRDIPDVSFFSGDGALYSASLICVSALGACTYSATAENTAQEVGGTSVATPQMAGVMALINQKAGAAQGLANPELYLLAGNQNYAGCSAETVKSNSSSCYFNDVDTGTIAMPCDLGAREGGAVYNNGWILFNPAAGIVSPNCAAINSVDAGAIGTLVSSGTTPGYNAGVGYDLATGLGSLNVANVVNAWVSEAGTSADTLTVTPTALSIYANQPLTVVVTITGSGSFGTPTGTVWLTGGGFSASKALSGGAATFTIPAHGLVTGSDLMTVNYSGDPNYISAVSSFTETVAVIPSTITVSAPLSGNVANAISVFATVNVPVGSPIPTGTAAFSSGSYNSGSVTLTSSGTAAITIPANSLAVGNDTLTATYSGSTTFAGSSGTASILIVNTPLTTPTVTVTPSPTSIDSSQPLTVTVAVSGTAGTPTGTVTLTAGSYSGSATALTGSGLAAFTVPGNSLSAGTATLTANYTGDANYSAKSGTGSVTVTQSVFALASGTPSSSSVTPGTTATVTISGSTSTTFYTGTVTLNSCALTTSPSGANTSALPSCSITGTITYANGVPTGSATATISTTATIASLTYPRLPNGRGNERELLGAGGSFVLAFLVFLGVPARRKAWRAMLGLVMLIAALGTLSACGGGSSSSHTSIPGTSAGAYIFTVTGTGSPAVTPAPTTTFTINVN